MVEEVGPCRCVGIVVLDFLHDRHRIMLRQNRPEHIKRTDIGRGLTAPIRIRRKNEIYERLPNHFSIALLAIIPSTKHTPLHFVYLVYFVVKIILATPSNTGRRPAMRTTEALEA